jgi:hypothetical protein
MTGGASWDGATSAVLSLENSVDSGSVSSNSGPGADVCCGGGEAGDGEGAGARTGEVCGTWDPDLVLVDDGACGTEDAGTTSAWLFSGARAEEAAKGSFGLFSG